MEKVAVVSEMLESSISDPEILFYIAEFIRVSVSNANAESIVECMIKIGIIPKLLSLLKVPIEKIQLEVAGALINIAHASSDESLRKSGAHFDLLALARSANADICENVSRNAQ